MSGIKKSGSVKLSAKWQLDAALLSRPVDLTALVTMSKSHPDKFIIDDTLHRLVSILLNEKNANKSDKDTKLDVLNILANVSAGSPEAVAVVRVALQGISEWFDDYMASEEADPSAEPELHKAMVLLLARCWNYKLKTEDVLELTRGNRRMALCTVVGLLEDGETYSTVLKQRQRPDVGKMGQWEHELVIHRFEKPLLLQICRLLRGFTHPGTYFEASTEEIALYSVERFAEEMNILLEITLRSRLVEKLCVAMYSCLFENISDSGASQASVDTSSAGGIPINMLDESDHMAVVSVHSFLQNLYFYASHNNDEFRRHMLVDTMLIPRLILPYLDKCVQHASLLNRRAKAYSDALGAPESAEEQSEVDRAVASFALDQPQLVKGIAASLRTLIIASFRAPATQYVMSLLRRLNPTASMLKASAFVIRHEYIFALLCLLNVNMGALDLSRPFQDAGAIRTAESYRADVLLQELARVYAQMPSDVQARVHSRVLSSGALPVSRDTPSYAAVMSVLLGGEAGQLEYYRQAKHTPISDDEEALGQSASGGVSGIDPMSQTGMLEYDAWDSRAEAKKAQAERLQLAKQLGYNLASPEDAASALGGAGASAGLSSAKEDGGDDEETNGGVIAARPIAEALAEPKNSAFQVAIAVATQSGAKSDSKSQAREKQIRGEGYRLLGDLPSLGSGGVGAAGPSIGGGSGVGEDGDARMRIELELGTKKHARMRNNKQNDSTGADAKGFGALYTSNAATGVQIVSGIPSEFLCAINGHVMKEPVRAKTSGLVFERATIELWLNTRGQICPITNEPLLKDQLVSDEELKNRIMRYHIQQTALRVPAQGAGASSGGTHFAGDDDLYDF